MQEFINFIEDSIDVEEQVDPEKDNVIHTFYRDHNTLHKMNENFRLLEYKRKKYLEKKRSQSRSPRKEKDSSDISAPANKNFLSSIYGGVA